MIDENKKRAFILTDSDSNDPDYRGAQKPPFKQYMVNPTEFPDELRLKYLESKLKEQGDKIILKIYWMTQEPFRNYDATKLCNEIERCLRVRKEKFNVDIEQEIEVNVEIECRDGSRYGHAEEVFYI